VSEVIIIVCVQSLIFAILRGINFYALTIKETGLEIEGNRQRDREIKERKRERKRERERAREQI
jgi:hypothetical protein